MRRLLLAATAAMAGTFCAAQSAEPAASHRPVPELGYRVVPEFFQLPADANFGEVAGVALNSRGHIYVFHRGRNALLEFDPAGRFVRSLGEGLFDHAHGLRVDPEDNIWTTDDTNHVVLKLSPEGRVLLVLGRRDMSAEAPWLFNRPTDVALGTQRRDLRDGWLRQLARRQIRSRGELPHRLGPARDGARGVHPAPLGRGGP